MKIYNIYTKKDTKFDVENSIFIEEGLSWRAALLNHFWFLYHKMWFSAILSFSVSILIGTLLKSHIINEYGYVVIYLFYLLVIAVFAATWQEQSLKTRNYILHDIICAKNLDKARLKYLTRHCLTAEITA